MSSTIFPERPDAWPDSPVTESAFGDSTDDKILPLLPKAYGRIDVQVKPSNSIAATAGLPSKAGWIAAVATAISTLLWSDWSNPLIAVVVAGACATAVFLVARGRGIAAAVSAGILMTAMCGSPPWAQAVMAVAVVLIVFSKGGR